MKLRERLNNMVKDSTKIIVSYTIGHLRRWEDIWKVFSRKLNPNSIFYDSDYDAYVKLR
jgi:hypothetical protein